jgi:hypothetical protein
VLLLLEELLSQLLLFLFLLLLQLLLQLRPLLLLVLHTNHTGNPPYRMVHHFICCSRLELVTEAPIEGSEKKRSLSLVKV